MTVVVDSSVLVAALHDEDTQHDRGVRALESAALPIIVPEYVAIETIGVLTVRKHKQSAVVLLQSLAKSKNLVFMPSTPTLFAVTAGYFLKTSKRLSFIDCSLVLLARGYTVLSFDQALLKAIHNDSRV